MKHRIAYIAPGISKVRCGSILIHLVALALSAACSPSKDALDTASQSSANTAETPLAPAAPTASSSAEPVDATSSLVGQGDGLGGGKGKRFGETVTYLDGKPLGVLRYMELPPNLQIHPQRLADGRDAPRYRVAEYLELLGVNLATVKEVHFLGGRGRAAIVPGDELRKFRSEFRFSFTRHVSGKARLHWPPGIKIATSIDGISAVAIYSERPPPQFDRKKKFFFDENNKRYEGIPFAKPEESVRGTRLYADGALVTAVKRKLLPDSVLSPRYEPTNPLFSLHKYLSTTSIELPRALALLDGDRVIARWDGEALQKTLQETDFSTISGSEGRITLHVGGVDFSPTAMMFAVRSPLPKRILEAKLEPPHGSSVTQPEDQKNAKLDPE